MAFEQVTYKTSNELYREALIELEGETIACLKKIERSMEYHAWFRRAAAELLRKRGA